MKTWPREQATQLYDGAKITEAKDAAYIYQAASKRGIGPRNMAVHAKVVLIDGEPITPETGEVIEIMPGLHRLYVECSITHTNPDGISPRRTLVQSPVEKVITFDFKPGTVLSMDPDLNTCPNAGFTIGEW